MIQADKSPLIMWGFTRFNRFFLRHHFQRIRVYNANHAPIPSRSLFLINHSSWWDALVIFFLNEQIVRSDAYGMMHEEGIRRFPFFKKIGVYSMNSGDRRHLTASLAYSQKLLSENKTVWMFPQGDEQHLEKRPLQFSNGAAYIEEHTNDINIIPVSLYYSLEHTRKPNVYAQLGRPIDRSRYIHHSRKEKTRVFEECVTIQLDELKHKVVTEKVNHFTVY
ncbi:lysophospholipid acyltransferase family protein [Halobacillus sp. A5]|uniref:lysophospholipid acyltransferase family protein n=1 Tax=Halobacillus sp. A5 TaxID=2880263 RepID=UPI0020A673AE|nr:lysophospholipid acyltransferase family protein [Halobacillus sp. A5]MCP3026309.1 lysophospholipid acyltransferase family protein [Halobacillus sp. A5]